VLAVAALAAGCSGGSSGPGDGDSPSSSPALSATPSGGLVVSPSASGQGDGSAVFEVVADQVTFKGQSCDGAAGPWTAAIDLSSVPGVSGADTVTFSFAQGIEAHVTWSFPIVIARQPGTYSGDLTVTLTGSASAPELAYAGMTTVEDASGAHDFPQQGIVPISFRPVPDCG
jgi:hypothetical protein